MRKKVPNKGNIPQARKKNQEILLRRKEFSRSFLGGLTRRDNSSKTGKESLVERVLGKKCKGRGDLRGLSGKNMKKGG